MIKKILDFCIRERLVVVVGMLAVFAYGWYAWKTVPLDAIPNVGENQVIVLVEWMGRSPKDMEDQITYPLSIALQSVPGAKSVRGKSMFGFSFVQVTFADSVDFYWARSRVAEQLTTVSNILPEGVAPVLAPDATALGQIYYYVLEPPEGMDLAELRSKQDFFVKYALQSVDGVAEVASIGGYVRQYQIEVDPDKLRYHDIPLGKVIDAVKASDIDVGAKTVEAGGMEFIVCGKGFIGSGKTEAETLEQIENTVVLTRDGVPVRVRDLAQVQTGPAFRRGALDFNGQEAVGGVVVMRYGENPREVIERVKTKIAALESELDGIKIHSIYDRTVLIDETATTLSDALGHEILITIAVIVLFLLHVRASIVIAITLPMAVLMAFIAMKLFGVDANIMSLAGIVIAIGTMVDMGIIIMENVYGGLSDWEAEGSPGGPKRRLEVIRESAGEVVPAVITAVSTTVVSFLPVFLLTGRDHRLFAPLAWTKTFCLAASLIVAVMVVPMLCRVFLKSSRAARWASITAGLAFAGLGGGLCYFVWGERIGYSLPWATAVAAGIGFLVGWWMSREKIRPMEENPASRFVLFLYAGRLRFALKRKLLMLSLPAMILVLGLGAWIGLPTVLLPVEKVFATFGADLNEVPGYVKAKHVFTGLKTDDWIALDEGSWFYMPSLYPAVMLQSGIKAPMAVRIYGDTLEGLGEASLAVGEHMKKLHHVNAATVNPDIVMGKPYFEFEVDREEAARYGMTTMMVNQIVSAGLGGLDVTTTVEGRERYPIQIRYQRDVRERIDELRQVPVVTHTGDVVPLERLAQVSTREW